MSGTKEGAQQTYKAILKKYGNDFYSIIGAKGGKSNRGGWNRRGFGTNRELASKVGFVGGSISKRRPRSLHVSN